MSNYATSFAYVRCDIEYQSFAFSQDQYQISFYRIRFTRFSEVGLDLGELFRNAYMWLAGLRVVTRELDNVIHLSLIWNSILYIKL